MKTVWKFPLPSDDTFFLWLPDGAEILTVQEQSGHPVLWALCDPHQKNVTERHFRHTGTGHPISDGNYRYIGTYQLYSGEFIGHLFEIVLGI